MKTLKLSDQVAGQLERRIAEGLYRAGALLPPERALAAELDVSRPTVREAINKLAAKGLINTRQGGGHRVADQVGKCFTDPLISLLGEIDDFHYDILEYRVVLEGMSAWYAAQRATGQDRQQLEARMKALEAAHSTGDAQQQADADAAFHQAIADASHNVMVQHNMRAMFALLSASIRESVFQISGQAQVGEALLQQHRALYQAIVKGEPEVALASAQAHLEYVEQRLSEERRSQDHRQRSDRRFRFGTTRQRN